MLTICPSPNIAYDSNIHSCHNPIKQKSPTLSNKMKGMILLGLKNKYFDIKFNKKQYFIKWYSKTKADKVFQLVIPKVLAKQRISQGTFFYRIKLLIFTDKSVENDQNHQIQAKNTIQQQNQQKYLKQNCLLPACKQTQYLTEPQNKRQGIKQIQDVTQNNRVSIKNQNLYKPIDKYTQYCNQRGHLRCISEQRSNPLTSERQFSQGDILESFDKQISSLETRIKVSGLRAVQLLMKKISQNNLERGFKRIRSYSLSQCENN